MKAKFFKMIFTYLLKHHGIELALDAVFAGAEKAANLTATNLDNNAVAKFKADKPALMKLIRDFL